MTAAFLTPLRLEYAADGSGQKFVAAPPFRYQSDIPEIRALFPDGIIEVPANFRTDLASVPRLPLAYWLFAGVGDRPAVIHDYLYSTRAVPRKVADAVFAEALKVDGVGAWRRGPMWAAVRLFGGSHYPDEPRATAAPVDDPYRG